VIRLNSCGENVVKRYVQFNTNSTLRYCDIFAAQRAELLNIQNSTTRSAIN